MYLCQRIFSLFLKITLLATEFWIDRFFFFLSRLFFCCHLASMISGERYSVMSFIIPLCVACHSSLDLFYLWLLAVWFWYSYGSFSLSFYCLKFVLLLVIVNLCLFPNLRSFSHFFHNFFFFKTWVSFSLLVVFQWHKRYTFWYCSTSLLIFYYKQIIYFVYILLRFFFSYFGSGVFYWFISKFHVPFHGPFHSGIESYGDF